MNVRAGFHQCFNRDMISSANDLEQIVGGGRWFTREQLGNR